MYRVLWGLVALATTAAPVVAAPPSAQALAKWHSTMKSMRPPSASEGCFQVNYPQTTWKKVQCVTAPLIPFAPANRFEAAGNGALYAAQTENPILAAQGSFPSYYQNGLFGFEYDSILGFNTFSLQMNTNHFATAACDGAANPATCYGWQQFIFDNSADTGGGAAFMQYWLINYNTVCPDNWTTYVAGTQTDCFMNSKGVSFNVFPIQSLATLALAGEKFPSPAFDIVQMSDSTAEVSVMQASPLGGAIHWTMAQFNVFGEQNGSMAVFSPETTVSVKLTVNSSSSSSCNSTGGFTGESNNLTEYACSPLLGENGIMFQESNE